MKKINWGKLSKNIFIIGILIFIISLFIPSEVFWEILKSPGITPAGFVLLYLLPIMGVIGIISAIIGKKFLWIIPNLFLVFSFFIVMSLGYLLLGP